MRTTLTWVGVAALALSSCVPPKPQTAKDAMSLRYPSTRQDLSIVDDYFGTPVADPYRWLEDDQSQETKAWVAAQNAVTQSYLDRIPFREALRSRLEGLWNFEKFGLPTRRGDHVYFFKNSGLQNQSVLYRQKDAKQTPEVVIDPNTWSEAGTSSLQELGFSKEGRYLAYARSEGGSDWRRVYVRDLSSGKDLADELRWVKFSRLAWDAHGFYYSRFEAPQAGDELKGSMHHGALYYHRLGQRQDQDERVFFDDENPKRFFQGGTTFDARYVYVTSSESTSGNALAVKDLSSPKADWVHITRSLKHDFHVVESLGNNLLILTNHEAPRQRLIRVDPKHPQVFQTLIPEHETDVLESVTLSKGHLVAAYLHQASSRVRVFDLDGRLVGEPELPELGSVTAVEGRPDETQVFFSFTSFLRPTTVYELDVPTLKIRADKVPAMDFQADKFVTKQVWFKSRDGTSVPMFITHRKDLDPRGEAPTLLYGYGGFNVSVTPAFSASRALLLEQGGVLAVANLRGGGEFGEAWHKAGTKCQKQNVFDDFIAAAEALIRLGYTQPGRLAIEGGSNGGLLVGAAMTQRPDLFGVCFPRVGVLDMLRYHQFTIGYAWAEDYGRSDDEQAFKCLYAYSPLHRVTAQDYPATLITTADHDDRVVPAHSFKFAATLQAKHTGQSPTLIRIETRAGHGAGKPTAMLLDEAADLLAFMFFQMGITPPLPMKNSK